MSGCNGDAGDGQKIAHAPIIEKKNSLFIMFFFLFLIFAIREIIEF